MLVDLGDAGDGHLAVREAGRRHHDVSKEQAPNRTDTVVKQGELRLHAISEGSPPLPTRLLPVSLTGGVGAELASAVVPELVPARQLHSHEDTDPVDLEGDGH